jgi:hypothetical protein
MKIVSFNTIRRGDWLLRVSVLGTEAILVVAFNAITFETHVRSYRDEMDAHLFMKYLVLKHLIKDDSNE